MEAILIAEGTGAWRSFDEIESLLTLDELIFIHKYLMKSKHDNYRMLAALQGIETEPLDDDESGGDDLPEEVIAAERAWQERKQAAIDSGEAVKQEMNEFGLGYERK